MRRNQALSIHFTPNIYISQGNDGLTLFLWRFCFIINNKNTEPDIPANAIKINETGRTIAVKCHEE